MILVRGKSLEKVVINNDVNQDLIFSVSKHSIIHIFMNLISNTVDALDKRIKNSGKINIMSEEHNDRVDLI